MYYYSSLSAVKLALSKVLILAAKKLTESFVIQCKIEAIKVQHEQSNRSAITNAAEQYQM